MSDPNPNLRTMRDGMVDRLLLKMQAEAIVENEALFDDWEDSLRALPDDTPIDAEFVARQFGISQVLAQAVLNEGWGDALEPFDSEGDKDA